MKGLRFLLLGLTMCLASGVKAQFYDSADDIYYYLEWKDGVFVENKYGEIDARIFNFDGEKAALLNLKGSGPWCYSSKQIKDMLKTNSSYFDDLIESIEYDFKFQESSTSRTTYVSPSYYLYENDITGRNYKFEYQYSYEFSKDREFIFVNCISKDVLNSNSTAKTWNETYKRVDKSFFRVGRSRTPSGTMHE